MRFPVLILTTIFGLFLSCLAAFGENVHVWEGSLDIPTYLLGVEDPNPAFPLGDQRRIYPYTMLDDLTDQREPKSYKAVFLENEYLKATILPELGGHLYSLYDKVNKREVFYRNNVVKYGLVSLRGAWLAGGVEFNFPNGHTVVTVSPVAFTAFQIPGGGATVVVGDVDQVTEMHWEVALTLRPGQARLEQEVTLFNGTPLSNLYWYWANAAIPATEDMQYIYPMREAYPHITGVVWSYPLHNGVDYSWYKNVRLASSLFARQVHRNFFGAYYHKTDYGVVHVGDYREVPGKKIWTWGVADDGLIWANLLSDNDGPYNEIQSGRYETQLSYEFIAPRRVESFTEYWYPVHGLDGGFVEATSQLALNVTFSEGTPAVPQHVECALLPTVLIKNARVRVKLGAQVLKDYGPVSFAPTVVVKVGVPVKDWEAAKAQIVVDVSASDGQTLLHWSAADPLDGNPNFVPSARDAAPPAKPAEKMSVEELYLRGVEQEKSGGEHTMEETYQAVLARDPGYAPALLKMAWRKLRAGDFPAAEGFITRALARDGSNPEILYAAGVIYRAEQRWTLAQDAFWSDIHYQGAAAPAFAQLGEIAIRRKNYNQATSWLSQSLSHNPNDGMALTDLAVSQRLAGRPVEAAKTIAQALERMPLLPYARAEKWRMETALEKAGRPLEDWAQPYPASADTCLEVAAWYRRLGDLPSSDAVLQYALSHLPGQSITPMVYYYLAANAREEGRKEPADEYSRQSEAASHVKVFPSRPDDAEVIESEMRAHPLNAQASYFLGNYLFAHGRYDDGAGRWSKASEQGFSYSVLMRNLGLYAWRIKNNPSEAAEYYESAVKLAPQDYRLYNDLDEIYFNMGDVEHRDKLFAAAPASVLDRDAMLVRRALVLIQERQYDRAVGLLMNHHYKPWEGGVHVREMYVLANFQKGKQALRDNNSAQAEAAFRKALEYPPNLGVGKPDPPHDEETWFWLGEALKAGGDADAARAAWTQAAEEGKAGYAVGGLYRALALRRLGQTEEADNVLTPLSQIKPEEKHNVDEFYAAGLLDLFDQRSDAAAANFAAALKAGPDFWPARLALEGVLQRKP